MAKAEIKINYEGIGQLLRGDEVRGVITEIASRAASEAGAGYAHREHDSGQRIIANVYANTEEAWKDNLQNNTLLKVLHK